MSITMSSELIQKTKTYKKLTAIRKTFVTKKENRKIINDGLAICRNIGFAEWSKSCGLSNWNIEIVRELFDNEKGAV